MATAPQFKCDFYLWKVIILLTTNGALDGEGGGSPMSHVEFKKWLCPLSLAVFSLPCRF